MGSLYLGGPTIQEVNGKMMGLSIYGVAVISGSLYSRFYGISGITNDIYLVPLTIFIGIYHKQYLSGTTNDIYLVPLTISIWYH